MIRKALFLLLILLLPAVLFSQSPKEIIDSLRIELTKSPNKEQEAKIYGDLCWYYNSLSIDSSLYFGNKALILARELEDRKLIAQTLSDLGAVNFVKGNIDESTELYKESLKIRIEDNDEEGVASLNFKLGGNLFKKSDYDGAMNYYVKALEYYEKQNNQQVLAILKTNMANVYTSLKNYSKALEYLEEAEVFFEENDLYAQSANNLIAIGNIYGLTGENDKALQYYERVIEKAELAESQHALSVAYNNIGSIYSLKDDSKNAIQYFEKSLEIREKENLEADAASSYLSLGQEYIKLGNYSKAKKNLLNSLNYFKGSGGREKLGDIYFSLVKSYAGLNRSDSVMYYLDNLREYRETTLSEDVVKVTNELETKYQTEKKERQILQQRADIAEQKLSLERKNLFILGLGALALLIGLLGYFLFRNQKLKAEQLKKENELKDALIKVEAKNRVQEERLRISQDLHDNIGSQLTFIISSLDNLRFRLKDHPEMGNRVDNISKFTRNTINELRGTIWAMNRGELTLGDLKDRVGNLIENAKSASPQIKFHITSGKNFDSAKVLTSYQGINLYRVVQEAINNAVKHSEADSIEINFEQINDKAVIRISDNGKGIDEETRNSGNGLRNMQNRMNSIEGGLMIESAPDKGTSLKISL